MLQRTRAQILPSIRKKHKGGTSWVEEIHVEKANNISNHISYRFKGYIV
jgi:hypothetical protein